MEHLGRQIGLIPGRQKSDIDEASLDLNIHGNPGISYSDFNSTINGEVLKYAGKKCYPPRPPIPAFCVFLRKLLKLTLGVNYRHEFSLAIDDSGNPHIAYAKKNQLLYAEKDPSGAWDSTVVDEIAGGGVWPPSISTAIDNTGTPVIFYQKYESLEEFFAWRDTTGWHFIPLGSAPNHIGGSSIIFDPWGSVHIAYGEPRDQYDPVYKGNLVYKKLSPIYLLPFPGMPHVPMDPDYDGLYEDLNANNRKDFNDVVLMFNHLQWIAANEPVSAFDFNGNSRIDFNDIVKLFGEI